MSRRSRVTRVAAVVAGIAAGIAVEKYRRLNPWLKIDIYRRYLAPFLPRRKRYTAEEMHALVAEHYKQES